MLELVKIHGDEWKLSDIQENVDWCKEQQWRLMKYDNPNDHEHCLICYWTIFKSENCEDGFGYYYGGSTWLCTECYAKFISKAEL